MSDSKNETGRFTPAEYEWDLLSDKEKQDIKKYGNPRKLGFLRFLMIVFALQPIIVLFLTQIVHKNDIVVDVAFIHYVLDSILYTVIFAMIWMRKRATRSVAIGVLIIDISLTIVDYFLKMGFQADGTQYADLLQGVVVNLLLLVYFLVSRRVKYACTRPLHTSDQVVEFDKAHLMNWKSWAYWRDLIVIFILFSIVGHWMEFGYCSLIKAGILPGQVDPTNQIWSDFLFPFPIYGAGAVVCAIVFYPLKVQLQKSIKNPVVVLILVFIIAGIVCSLLELILGLTTNSDLKTWDYTNMFCNFMGQVCLQNSIGFALAATIMTYVVYPLAKLGFAKIDKYMNIVFVGVLVFGILLFAFYYFNYLPDKLQEIDPEFYEHQHTISQFGK